MRVANYFLCLCAVVYFGIPAVIVEQAETSEAVAGQIDPGDSDPGTSDPNSAMVKDGTDDERAAPDIDRQREQELAKQFESLDDSVEMLWLGEGDEKFAALFSAADSSEKKGALLILHDVGAHPDWPDLVQPLRRDMPSAGWAVLVPQLPLPSSGSPRTDYQHRLEPTAARIALALADLNARGYRKVVIVGHGFGASVGVNVATGDAAGQFAGFIAVGSENEKLPDRLPFLDVYGSRDYPNVIRAADKRARSARRSAELGYQRVEMEGADHRFTAMEKSLVKRIRGWLERT